MSSASTSAAPRGRLLRKYIVVFVGLVGGVLMASSLIELYFAYQQTKEAIVREERATAVAAAAAIEEFVGDIERRVLETTRAASDDPAAAQLGLGKLAFRGGLGAALAEQRQLDFLRLLRDVPAIAELSHLDVSGKEQLRVSRLALDAVGSQEDSSQTPKFLETRSGKTYWSPVYFRTGVHPYVTFAVPVGQYAVEITAVEISLKPVQQLIAQTRVGRGGYAYVVDSRGRLFAHPDMGLVRQGRDLSALPQVRDARAAARPAAPGGPPGSTVPPASGANEAVTVAEGLRGGQILAAHAAIAPLGWLVVVERPLAEAYAPLRAPIIRSVVIFVLGLALSIMASVLLARRMVAPIRALQEGASRIGAGDLAHRVDVRTGDELEALGNELNRTVGHLEESYANLEQKVEARTRELAAANAGLTETLEQQTATAEILRAISSSPTDIRPVLDTVVSAAARFCGATDVAILQLEGATLRGAAGFGHIKDVIVGQLGSMAALEVPVTRRSVTGRAVVDRDTVHVGDLAAEPEDEFPDGRALQARFGHHAMVATPLLREGIPVGAIALFRMVAESFSDRQLDLLRLFAAQAVIAIENVRLFTELEARNRDLTETLEQQTATSEVLKVISRSAFDLQPVFDTLAANAVRLCDAERAFIYRFDGEFLRAVTAYNAAPELVEAVQRTPLTPGRDSCTARAALDRHTVHIPDAQADPEYTYVAAHVTNPARTILSVPMLAGETLVGVLTIYKLEVRPFTAKQIALVETFADQAVIAIENVRLFKELETKNRDLTETLEQQTATAEILRVISSSPTDVEPVFDTIAESAVRLCEAEVATVTRFDGEWIHVGAIYGSSAAGIEALRRTFPMRPSGAGGAARAIRDRALVHIPDILTDPQYQIHETAMAAGFRALLGVPMLRDGAAIGAITLGRAKAGAFSETQVQLLRTFADQAVIAIENVRLFTELEARNAELTGTLARQTATGEVLRAISHAQTDAQPVFDIIAASALRLCGGGHSGVWLYDGDLVHLAALENVSPDGAESIRRAFPIPADERSMVGRAIVARAVVQIADVLEDPAYGMRTQAHAAGFRSFLAAPMLRGGEPIGVIGVSRADPGPAPESQIELLQTFADQAVIAIENVRLFTELEARNRDLTETLEQQTATAEILRVISSSPTDTQPVFDTIARSAAQLCAAEFAWVFRFEGGLLHFTAQCGLSPAALAEVQRVSPMPLGRGSAAARSILSRAIEHIPDVLAETDYELGATAHVMTFRSVVAVPMLRDDLPLGTIVVARSRVGLFHDRHIGLLKTFADQAVIAIENVRLFKELETKNADLTATLEQQTATGEILRVISSSPTDTQPVFDTIAERAMHLCGASVSGVLTYDGELVHIAALANVNPEGATALRSAFPMRPSLRSGSARAILTATVVHIPDNLAEEGYEIAAQAGAGGFRSVLSLPMLREGQAIGCVTVGRPEPGRFSDRQIALLKTFADQAVIAIENVRLFKELETRNRDLTETLEQQTATSEVLRVISGSPTDVQPVFDTIARNAARLCQAQFCFVYRFDGQLLHFVGHHGVTEEGVETVRRAFPAPPNRGSAAARAVLNREVAQIPDVLTDPDFVLAATATTAGYRSAIAVPMLRDGLPIGSIAVARAQAGLLPDRQIELLKTFADQAVIAIENVRLFKELETKNHDLTETLEQQTATAEILRVISSSPTDVQPVFDAIVQSAVRLCGGLYGFVGRFDGEQIFAAAHHNYTPEALAIMQRMYPMRPSRQQVSGRVILSGSVVQIEDVQSDPEYALQLARAGGWRSSLGVPLLRDGRPTGVITVMRGTSGRFPETQIDLLKTFADQAVIAIENVRLFTELETKNHDLTETLEQQTATSEVLKVISRSAFDLQPVLQTLIENATRLCSAEGGTIYRFDGELLRLAAAYNMPAELRAFVDQNPLPPGRGTAVGRSLIEGRAIHIHDVQADPDYTYAGANVGGYRTLLGVPMLRDGAQIGVFAVYRTQVMPFTDRQIELVTTFADQGAIAIENVRLFSELEVRTRDLTRSVGELRALGEVSQAVSSTLDLDAVLATIVSRAVELSGSYSGIVYEFDEAAKEFHARATHRITPEYLEVLRSSPIRLGEGAIGRAGVIGEPVEVADVEDKRHLVAPQVRGHLAQQGIRSFLALPLIREGRLLGGLVILRQEHGAFSPEVVATLRTFAAQSVLAIHNAGLFREIQRQKQYSDALVQTSPVAIVTMDLNGKIVGWNPGAERLFQYTQAEALGRTMEPLVGTPEVRDEIRANVRHTLEGEGIRAIGRRARKDGTLVDVEISSMPVLVEGARVGMIGIYHDITELLRARREAETANEAKSAFLATMSHEIRTPMNAVIGMSGLLLNTSLTEEQREYAEVVRQSGDALLTVINDILDFSKIEAGKLDLESQPFDLRECVEGALDLVASRAAEKGLDLAYLVGDGAPPGLMGDVTRLRQVLLNLLSNAVKFTERGEVVLSVSARQLDAATRLHELTFSVRDTGIGIPPDRLGRLFQSFSQVDASTTRRYGGTGLGLAISQRLTELMGGRISVTSQVGVGSEFSFTIRAAAADAPAPIRRDLSGVQPTLRGKQALVVDDNDTNRRILTTHFAAWGMHTRATGSPVEALAWVQSGEPFDIGILDMHMPEMDGVTLARAIRERAAATDLPLILFTSLGRREAQVESEGFAAYLHKPIKPSQLFDALVSVLAEQPVHVAARETPRSEIVPDIARRHPLRILLAEDNVVNQKVALRLLGQMGYRADVAANGLEAIDAVGRQVYDVVLMDVQMPELDGFEASREINRRWPGDGRPRIVAMTANAMQGDRELCAAAGMDDYVAKPVRIEELVAALERTPRRAEASARVAPAGGPAEPAEPAAPRHSGVSRRLGAAAGARRPGPGAPNAGQPSTVDRTVVERLTAMMGGPFVAELIHTFVEDGRAQVDTLHRALAAADVDAFRRAAHTLKSTSETVGAMGLSAMARELEAAARAGSLSGTEARVAQVDRAFEMATHTLEELRRGLPG